VAEDPRVAALVAPIVAMFAEELGAELEPQLQAGLENEARSLVGALDQGFEEKELRDHLVRQVELEVLGAPAEKRAAVLRAWSGTRELTGALEPLGLRSRELVRELRASGRTDDLVQRAQALTEEIVRAARAAPPEVLARERGTVAVILMNCVTVLTDSLLGYDPEQAPEVG